jgi:hypothetical protein
MTPLSEIPSAMLQDTLIDTMRENERLNAELAKANERIDQLINQTFTCETCGKQSPCLPYCQECQESFVKSAHSEHARTIELQERLEKAEASLKDIRDGLVSYEPEYAYKHCQFTQLILKGYFEEVKG